MEYLPTSIDDITTTIEQEQKLSGVDLRNDAPVIYYKRPACTSLVLMDGEPSLKDDSQLNMKRVINTAFLIVQNPDDKKILSLWRIGLVFVSFPEGPVISLFQNSPRALPRWISS